MAAAKASGVGGLGWLVLGVAIGAAAVLAVQTFARKSESVATEAPAASHMLTIAPAAAPAPVAVEAAPAPKAHAPIEAPAPSAAPASAAAAAVATQDAAQVADDAAAVGMTSRSVN
jgi:hypothetical protein